MSVFCEFDVVYNLSLYLARVDAVSKNCIAVFRLYANNAVVRISSCCVPNQPIIFLSSTSMDFTAASLIKAGNDYLFAFLTGVTALVFFDFFVYDLSRFIIGHAGRVAWLFTMSALRAIHYAVDIAVLCMTYINLTLTERRLAGVFFLDAIDRLLYVF